MFSSLSRTLRIALVLLGVGLLSLAASRLVEDGTAPSPVERRAPHFVDSSPTHGQEFAFGVNTVVVNFDFVLGTNSTVTVTDPTGTEITSGAATVDTGGVTLRRAVAPNGTAGIYTVRYRACWPDGSCHDGRFTYTVDPSLSSRSVGRTGQPFVTVRMNDIAYDPPHILVSPGTKVTWINDEAVEHFINTDPHPSHTLFPTQNSLGVATDETFEVTFTEPGEYPYHCSAHVPQGMAGSVLVQ